MSNSVDPKERIIQAASHLFAQKGYSAIGVREIVREADVNISMISYYFKGKTGVLLEIINRFFDLYAQAIEGSFVEQLPFEDNVYTLVKNLVTVIQNNKDLFKIGFFELPLEVPEVAEIRAERINKIRELLGSKVFADLKMDAKTKKYLPIIGPAMISMVFSNFIMGPSLQNVFKAKFDTAFYDDYARIITSLIINGLPVTISKIRD